MSPRSALAACAAVALCLAAPVARAADKPLDKAAVEKIVRDYLLANPEVLLEAMQVLETRSQAESAKSQRDAIQAAKAELFESKTSPVGGNPKGDVTLVEFFDYNCGFCKRANPERDKAVATDGKVRIVFKELPILGPSSVTAARAALAARAQGKYVELHEAMFDQPGSLTDDAVFKIAEAVKIDVKRLRRDMEDPAIDKEIEANRDLARKLGIRGTPGFIVGDQLIPGAIDAETFAKLFADARQAAKDGSKGK